MKLIVQVATLFGFVVISAANPLGKWGHDGNEDGRDKYTGADLEGKRHFTGNPKFTGNPEHKHVGKEEGGRDHGARGWDHKEGGQEDYTGAELEGKHHFTGNQKFTKNPGHKHFGEHEDGHNRDGRSADELEHMEGDEKEYTEAKFEEERHFTGKRDFTGEPKPNEFPGGRKEFEGQRFTGMP